MCHQSVSIPISLIRNRLALYPQIYCNILSEYGMREGGCMVSRDELPLNSNERILDVFMESELVKKQAQLRLLHEFQIFHSGEALILSWNLQQIMNLRVRYLTDIQCS